MIDVLDATDAIHIRRVDPVDWSPKLDQDDEPFIGRIARVAHVSRGKAKSSLQRPEHEFEFNVPVSENKRQDLCELGLRVFGHEFGLWSVISIWENREFVYHATVQIPRGMEWEKVASQIFSRWVDTRPTGPGQWGIGKSSG